MSRTLVSFTGDAEGAGTATVVSLAAVTTVVVATAIGAAAGATTEADTAADDEEAGVLETGDPTAPLDTEEAAVAEETIGAKSEKWETIAVSAFVAV
ncbi:MAG: hypothetical protein Q8P16_00980, partial [bacterium]|nr:hypothetical protein [bacterium]